MDESEFKRRIGRLRYRDLLLDRLRRLRRCLLRNGLRRRNRSIGSRSRLCTRVCRRLRHVAHHAKIRARSCRRGARSAVFDIPGHKQADRKEHDRQPLGGLGQKVGRAARTEHSTRGTTTEATTGLSTGAALHQDQHDHCQSNEHVNDVKNQHNRNLKNPRPAPCPLVLTEGLRDGVKLVGV